MADVFLSYAREDRERAQHIAKMLEDHGIDVFWDNEIPPGSSWADFIESKLKNAKAMIVLWSAASVASQWVREEARLGRDAGKLIPAALDTSAPPFGFGEVQSADLSQWNGLSDHPDWHRFLLAIEHRIGKDAEPATGSGASQTPFGASSAPQPPPAQPFGAQATSFTQQAGGDANAFGGSAAASRPSPQMQAQTQGFTSSQTSGSSAAVMSPTGYITKCMKLYADGKGRAGQAEFWWFMLFVFIAFIAAAILDGAVFGIVSIFTLIVSVGLIAPAISVTSRRLHDFNVSGWVALVTIVPYVGAIGSIIIGLTAGKAGPNQYGPDPRNPEDLGEVFG